MSFWVGKSIVSPSVNCIRRVCVVVKLKWVLRFSFSIHLLCHWLLLILWKIRLFTKFILHQSCTNVYDIPLCGFLTVGIFLLPWKYDFRKQIRSSALSVKIPRNLNCSPSLERLKHSLVPDWNQFLTYLKSRIVKFILHWQHQNQLHWLGDAICSLRPNALPLKFIQKLVNKNSE